MKDRTQTIFLLPLLVMFLAVGAASPQLAELQKRVDQEKATLDGIDQKRDQLEHAQEAAGDTSQNLQDARSALASLESLKQNQQQQQNQSLLDQRTQQNEFRLETQVEIAQLRDQLAHEQNVSQDLDRRLQEQQNANLNTDDLHALEIQAPAQQQKVADLQVQYQQLQYQYADSEAASLAAQQSGPVGEGEDLMALDDQIRQQQAVVGQLEKQDQDNQQAQQAGVSQDELLGDQYTELKRSYDEDSRSLDLQKKALALQAGSSHE